MRRLRALILVFVVALAVPLGYLVHRTHGSLEQEETAELRFFANTLFDQMEQELAALVQREERRPVDEYQPFSPGSVGDRWEGAGSPLARAPAEPYILGYFQSNPDGSFTTPTEEGGGTALPDRGALLTRLREVNRTLNAGRATLPDRPALADRQVTAKVQKKGASEEKELQAGKAEETGFAEKYLNVPQQSKQKAHLGQAESRVEQISPQQALNLARSEVRKDTATGRSKSLPAGKSGSDVGTKAGADSDTRAAMPRDAHPTPSGATAPPLAEQRLAPAGEGGAFGVETAGGSSVPPVAAASEPRSLPNRNARGAFSEDGLRVEVDPLQSVPIDQGQVLVFRRIVIGNEVYRQGMVIGVEDLLRELKEKHFSGQPMARFTSLTLTAMNGERETARIREGREIAAPRFALERSFPRPFSFVRATLECEEIPRSPGRTTLNAMVVVLAAVILAGLLAIYQSARVVTDLSERRSGFVSSVTHELKTPLTNIRLYIEMLEQGIAATDPEREMEYYRIVESESARLSRLINNVLEFSKLERRQRRLDLREGTLEEVLAEVRDAMREWLRQEGFTLTVENALEHPFPYDREVMVQVLMNLIENGVKFGKSAERREIVVRVRAEGDRVLIRVSDTGPGIPRLALKKIFGDFYRVDNQLTRTTKGTGIGLALVKRFVEAMGGSVSAANNDGPGCTITLSLPGAGPSMDAPHAKEGATQ
ncbi:MAG: sensor histidine kinase [Syntrophobacteraceae bacterium]